MEESPPQPGAQVVLYFKPARLLVTSDLFWNYPGGAPGGTKLWKFGMDQAGHPALGAFMFPHLAPSLSGINNACEASCALLA